MIFLGLCKLPAACDSVIRSETSDSSLNNIGALHMASFC